jgi:hypothetical protein
VVRTPGVSAVTFARPARGARAALWAAALYAFGSSWLTPAPAFGEPPGPCRFRVEADDAAPNRSAAVLLRRDAQRLGLCQRSWVIKLARTQPGTYTIALWTASDLETRSTDDPAQIVPVSQLLLRVAVERSEAPAEALGSGTTAPELAPAAPEAPAPPAAPAPPPEPLARGIVALRLGPQWAERAGWGLEVGVEAGIERGLGRWSLAPRVASASGDPARITTALPLRFGFHESEGLGAFAELGLVWQRIGASDAGVPADARWGLGLGAGASFTHKLGQRLRWHVALPLRYDFFSTEPDEALLAAANATPTTPGNNGNGNGNGKKNVGPTASDVSDAARRFGGFSVGLQLGLTLPL